MDEIEEMLPTINVPEKFDLLGSGVHATELAAAKTGKFNPVLQSALEVDYAGKRFNTEPEVRDELSLVLTLDPLANITDDDKMVRLSNKGITLETYIISSNIQAFIQRAMAEQTDFPSMQLSEQKAVLIKYAQEQVAAALDTLIPMEEQDPENNIYGQAV